MVALPPGSGPRGTGRRRGHGGARTAGLASALVALGASALLAGCGPGAAAAAAGGSGGGASAVRQVQGRTGALVLGDGYVTEPASPDVAAAYLTVQNTGSTPARLAGVSSPIAATVLPMTEKSSGTVGSMAPLGEVVVPPHGAFRFRAGAAHLMLEQPRPVPVAGGTVPLTLTFTPGGTATVALPVVPIGATRPSGDMPGMSTPTG